MAKTFEVTLRRPDGTIRTFNLEADDEAAARAEAESLLHPGAAVLDVSESRK